MANPSPIIKYDGLVNFNTGLGTASSKRANNKYVYSNFINYAELDVAYREDWLARQIVDVPAQDALREGRRFVCADAEEISKVEEMLNVMGQVQECYSWSRLYGGSIIIMITNQDLEQPLNVNRIRKGNLRKLLVFERFELSTPIVNVTNPLADNYLEPEFYQIMGGSQRIHHSHVIRFEGERLPRRIRFHEQGWGDSILRKVMDDLLDVVSAKGGVAELIQEANVDTITRENLANELAGDEEQAILNRFKVFREMKSNHRLSLLDGQEQYERKSISFSGVAEVLNELRIWISGAADIPVTRLFGESAKGLSATGEGDLNNYHDSIRSKQTKDLTPKMRQLDEVLVRSALGFFPDDCEFEWNPLTQLSGEEIARQGLANAQTDRIYLDDNIITEAHIARRLQQESVYGITDQDIEELEKRVKEQRELLDFTGNEDLLNGFNFPRSRSQSPNSREPRGTAQTRPTENQP